MNEGRDGIDGREPVMVAFIKSYLVVVGVASGAMGVFVLLGAVSALAEMTKGPEDRGEFIETVVLMGGAMWCFLLASVSLVGWAIIESIEKSAKQLQQVIQERAGAVVRPL